MAASYLAVLSVHALLTMATTVQAPNSSPAAAPKAPATPPPAMPLPTSALTRERGGAAAHTARESGGDAN